MPGASVARSLASVCASPFTSIRAYSSARFFRRRTVPLTASSSDAVPPRLLRLVERLIRGPDDPVRRLLPAVRLRRADAHGDGDSARVPGAGPGRGGTAARTQAAAYREAPPFDVLPQGLEVGEAFGHGPAREQEGKLLAAIAECPPASRCLRQSRGDHP